MTTYTAYDAGRLRPYTRGDESPLWWGAASLASMASIVYAGLIFSYFYLRMGAPSWPPGLLGPPRLLLPTIGSFLLWLSAIAVWRAQVRRHGLWLLVSVLLAAGFEALKVAEMSSLPFGWDTHTYGSIFWVMNGFQFLNVAALILWAIPLAVMAARGHVNERRRAGLEATRIYWNTPLVWWVFFYLVLYYAPRVFLHTP